VVAIVDPRQQVADLDALPFLDRLGDYLAENLGADNDVLVLRHDIAAAGQPGAGLSRLFHRDDRGLRFGGTANRPLIDEKSGRAGHRENREHDRGRDDSARLLRVARARNPQRLELADIGPPRRFGGQGQTLLSASTMDIFIACRAGSQPPTMPITAAKISASITIAKVTWKLNARVENVTKLPNVVLSPFIGI